MALVLGLLGSGRKDGYTVKVLTRALEAAAQVEGVEVELLHLLDYRFGPCRSCYTCIRNAEHRCIQRDDMGSLGAGRLWERVEQANAMIWATPVHCWAADALIHLFIERLYPFLWSGELRGIPVATLAVASNQGFQEIAHKMLCQWAFTTGARYVGGLAVHAAYLDEALMDASDLGQRTAVAALRDAADGRTSRDDTEHWLAYLSAPWSVLPHYVENLTRGTGNPALSIIRQAIARDTFKRPEAIALLREADVAFGGFADLRALNDTEGAVRKLVEASALWTHATWKEFLEEQLIGTSPPEAYRPLVEA
jgi:multimeric flavodoxin WrbA